MMDFTKHSDVIQTLPKVQEPDTDNRDRSRDSDHFLNKEDGQWEPKIWQAWNNQPRYTFDLMNPIVDQIMGEIDQSEFSISVRPASGEASKETAKVYDGLIRNIENISNSKDIYRQAGRRMVGTAISGWRIVHDWVNQDSFEQDLLIKPISNFVDRVWFDTNAEMPDMSDAEFCYVLNSMSKHAYGEQFPKGSGLSVGDDRDATVYCHRKEEVVVGEIIFKKKQTRELALMSNGAVYDTDSDEFKKVKDELAGSGVTVDRTRKRKVSKVFTRLFDGGDWLSKEQETPFSMLPVIPCYANFEISENKVIYWSAIQHLMDHGRVYNYAKSRQIREGALAPVTKTWLTREQAARDVSTLSTQNTNADPVQTYTHTEGQPPPFQIQGPQVNVGLQQTANDAKVDVNSSSGLFAANMGNNQELQSGVALELQIGKGDNGTFKYFTSIERAIIRTCQILVDTIPRVYDSKRQVMILDQAGAADVVTLNDIVFDEETGKNVEVNNLSRGTFDVTCKITEAFSSQREKTVKAISNIAAVDPSIIQEGADVWLSNIDAPGVDLIAERRRQKMVIAGIIPESQLTDEEKIIVQQIQSQPQPPDPTQQLIEAQFADIISKAAEREDKIKLSAEKELNRAQEKQDALLIEIEKLRQNQEKIDNSAQNDQANILLQGQQQIVATQQALDDQLKTQAETLKLIREAQGIDTFTGPHGQEAFIDQAALITETQEQRP